MNANDVIESYVTDVAMHLPRKQRNDVAFELRALLHEELQAKAETTGRAADASLAIELSRAFGRPTEVAARYRPTLTIIDPADGPGFLRASVIGLVIIWLAGLLMRLGQPIDSAGGLLGVIAQWWGGTVIPSLWWPGVLVVGYGVSSRVGQRWPHTAAWTPRAGDRIKGGRTSMVLGVVGILCGLSLLVDPHWLLDVMFQGRAAPAAYDAFTYTESFLGRQGPVLFVLVAINIPILIWVITQGRWSVLMRRIESGLSLVTCAALIWTVLGGPVMLTSVSNRTFKFCLVAIVAFTLIHMAMQYFRSVRPTPARQIQTGQ